MEDYVQNSPFARILGKPSRVKLLDVLLMNGPDATPVDLLGDATGERTETVRTDLEVLISANIVQERDGGYGLADTSEADLLRDYHRECHSSLSEIVDVTDAP